jgi:putative thioredoxin
MTTFVRRPLGTGGWIMTTARNRFPRVARLARGNKLTGMEDSSPNDTPWIVETTQDTFERDVFERSKQVPVVVDFWAAWCQPCRALAPILEDLANEYAGKFVLVKAETDQVPQAAAEFGVQSIPAVYGVCDGQVVDFFQGALPPQQCRAWINGLLLAGLAAEARRLEASDPQAAELKYRQLIERAPHDSAALIALAHLLLQQNRADECRALIEQLEQRGFLEPEAEKVKAELQLQQMKGGDINQLRSEAQANPNDLRLQFQLAEALAGGEHYEEALQICLDLVQKDRKGIGEEARQVMVDIFRVLPGDSDLISTYRRKLSMAMY